MKKIDLECSNCGAMMQVSDDKTEVFCPYCRNRILLKKEESIEELSKKEEKLSYAREAGERKAIEDSIIRQKRRKIFITIMPILIVFLIIIFSSLIQYFSLEYMRDPFECISVKFNGINGNGIVKIVNTNKCEEYADIKYVFSKDNKLNNGQKIKITAASDKYRFGIKFNEYIVDGLSMYLVNLDDLTNEMVNKLHDFSYEHLKDNLGITFSGEVVKLVPYKLFLYTDGGNKNTLYDVYKISIKTRSGNTYDKFVVAYYDDLVILNNSELFSYSRLYHCGNSILAGDPGAYNAISKDYAGFITGFKSINDFKSYINQENDGSFEIKER